MCSIPQAALTKRHKQVQVASNNSAVFSSSPGGWKPGIEAPAGHAPPNTLDRSFFASSWLSVVFLQSQELLGL